MHVSLESRAVTNIPEAALRRLAEIKAAHAEFERPRFVGRSIGLDWKPRT